MAALSSAESPPPVFNGDTAERDPGRERALEELGAGLDSTCSSGSPGGRQDEEVSVKGGSGAGLKEARPPSRGKLDINLQETPTVTCIIGDAVQGEYDEDQKFSTNSTKHSAFAL